jgi:hypothetical protein
MGINQGNLESRLARYRKQSGTSNGQNFNLVLLVPRPSCQGDPSKSGSGATLSFPREGSPHGQVMSLIFPGNGMQRTSSIVDLSNAINEDSFRGLAEDRAG